MPVPTTNTPPESKWTSTLRKGGTIFRFTPYLPGEGRKGSHTIDFRALIDSISYSVSPQWQAYNDAGRADPKYMYQSIEKTAHVTFKTVALTAGEQSIWIRTLNALAEMAKPVYKKGLGFNGIYINVVIGGYLNVMGFITGLNFDIDNESPWVSLIDNAKGDRSNAGGTLKDLVPVVITCSFDIQVLGQRKPKYRRDENLGGELGNGLNGQFDKGISDI